MKITEHDKSIFKEIQTRHNLKEGILSMIFKKKLKSALMGDKKLQDALADADKSLDRLKRNVNSLEKQGYKIPAELKKYI